MLACGIGPGDEVIVQSFTFCASANPVLYLGATPVFVDSEKDTWDMDPDLLEEAIRDRIAKTGKAPKAIEPVSLYGMPYRIDRILEVAGRYGIPVIEDSAEALGSRFDGRMLGTFGQFGVLSFNGNKIITTSGGGAVICPDAAAKERILWMATQARESYPYYQHEAVGYNYRLSNICAGIGRGQMEVVRDYITHHQRLHDLYRDLLSDVPGITVHGNPEARITSNFWLNTITLDPTLRIDGQENAYAGTPVTDCQPNDNVEALRRFLDRAGVETRPLWKPLHRQPVYQSAPAYVNGVSEALFKVGLCLPSGANVSEDDAQYIVNKIKEAIHE
jgi:dTDP-4-amino-4,6-dideoxygalactose transaminase